MPASLVRFVCGIDIVNSSSVRGQTASSSCKRPAIADAFLIDEVATGWLQEAAGPLNR
jgi:hypothetical protein